MLDPRMPYQYSRNPHSRPKSRVNIADLYARVSDCRVVNLDDTMSNSKLEVQILNGKPIFVYTTLIETYNN